MKTQTSEHSSEPKTALITGASRGIGKATARLFAQKGYRLYITCCNSMKELESTALKLQAEYHISCIPVRADMGNYEDVERLFSQISSLDVLVNNAGTAHIGLLTDMTAEEWHRVLSVNLDSCFYTCKCAIPLMLQKHSGRIINVSSVWGNVGASMETAYSASKGGVNSFTKALAKELAPSNIQVNAVACGVMDTAMNHCLSPEDMDALKAEIPADRLGDPMEAAKLILQISEAPTYMTGQIITIDGGWY